MDVGFVGWFFFLFLISPFSFAPHPSRLAGLSRRRTVFALALKGNLPFLASLARGYHGTGCVSRVGA